MKTASISEAKNQLSALIDRVRHGDTVVITNRGRPVAQLRSLVDVSDGDVTGRLERLEREGAVRPAHAAAPAPSILRRPPRAKQGASIVRVLLEERAGGR